MMSLHTHCIQATFVRVRVRVRVGVGVGVRVRVRVRLSKPVVFTQRIAAGSFSFEHPFGAVVDTESGYST